LGSKLPGNAGIAGKLKLTWIKGFGKLDSQHWIFAISVAFHTNYARAHATAVAAEGRELGP
jgi:hypothetical protein